MTEEAELLQALIRHGCVNDGVCPVPETPSALLVRDVLDGSGIDIEMYEPAPGRTSLVARLPGTDPEAPTLMLLAHTDVVPAVSERWDRDPLGGEIVDGWVWGRGALDMLGHVATMALAVRDHAGRRDGRRGDLVFAAVADEEAMGGWGTGWLVDNQPDAMAADWVLTESGGSPAGSPLAPRLPVGVAEKGVWRVRLRVHGVAGHAATPWGADSALVTAAEVVTRLARYRQSPSITDAWRRFVETGWQAADLEGLTDQGRIDGIIEQLPPFAAALAHALTRMTWAPTDLRSAGGWNVIPAEASIDVTVRVVGNQGEREILSALQEALGDLTSSVDVEIVDGTPATQSPQGTRLWQIMEQAAGEQLPGATLIPTVAAAGTDARFLRQRGAVAYGFGLLSGRLDPPQMWSMVHGDNERIDVDSLVMMRRLWADILYLHARA